MMKNIKIDIKCLQTVQRNRPKVIYTHKQPLFNFEFPKHEISSADRDSIQLQEEDLLHESMTEAGRHKGAGEELQFYMSYSSF